VKAERLGDELELSFTGSSDHDEAVRAAAMAVFRDGAGKVVGGVVLTEPGRCTTFEPGQSRRDRSRVREDDVPTGADVGRTEVFLEPYAVGQSFGCGVG
jgi:hypothetical protein